MRRLLPTYRKLLQIFFFSYSAGNLSCVTKKDEIAQWVVCKYLKQVLSICVFSTDDNHYQNHVKSISLVEIHPHVLQLSKGLDSFFLFFLGGGH